VKELTWGQTPWDDMPREELIREVVRMHAAMRAAENVIAMWKWHAPDSAYWNAAVGGVGGVAMGKIALARAHVDTFERHGTGFAREAEDLLFPGLGPNWRLCEVCKDMTARGIGNPPADTCFRCGGPVRPLTWDDMKPIATEAP
jgi:hypothetical protein